MTPPPKPKRQPHGRWMRCTGDYKAYLPAPLPPRIEWSAGLAAALSAADRAVGRLAGEGRRLSNPHLLIRPFVRREAVLSSRIEGTQATLGELLAAEAGAARRNRVYCARDILWILEEPPRVQVGRTPRPRGRRS